MSVIANFRKRKQREAQSKSESPKVKENTALKLLAQLLNVDEENAISTATKYVESNISFFAVDPAEGKDKTVVANVEIDDKGNVTTITEIEEHEAVKEELADDIENSAENVNSAASKVENSADDLAYAADDITAATDVLKEATAEIKKPLAAPKSSNSKNQTKQKSSTKK